MAHDSRLRIVEVLKRRHEASVTELSQALGLTPVTIRHHLASLLSDEVISDPIPRRKSGPGRPEMVYGLTPRADELTPRNYGELCACLLHGVGGIASDPLAVLDQAGASLAAQACSRMPQPGLANVLAFLEARGYFPSLEQGESGTTVVLANCPYLEVSRAMPDFCRFDIAFLESTLGAKVSVEKSIAQHDASCRLRLAAAAPV